MIKDRLMELEESKRADALRWFNDMMRDIPGEVRMIKLLAEINSAWLAVRGRKSKFNWDNYAILQAASSEHLGKAAHFFLDELEEEIPELVCTSEEVDASGLRFSYHDEKWNAITLWFSPAKDSSCKIIEVEDEVVVPTKRKKRIVICIGGKK